MKTLLILRHAKSSRSDAGLADHDRPLNERGLRDAPRMGRLARDEALVPDLILTSTAERARTTTALFAEACKYQGAIIESPEAYHAQADDHVLGLRLHGGEHVRVMIVAHNPALEELLEALTGSEEPLPTAALAVVALSIGSWGELTLATPGRLIGLWRPRDLP